MNIIAEIESGSHLYGLNTPASDRDYMGIYVPSFEDLVMGNASKSISTTTGSPDSKNGADDIDRMHVSLPRVMASLYKGEMTCIDMLHANPHNIITISPEFQQLIDCRTDFYSQGMTSFVGFMNQQALRYGVRGQRMKAVELVYGLLCGSSAQNLQSDPVLLGALEAHSKGTKYIELMAIPHPTGVDQQYLRVVNKKFALNISLEQVIKSVKGVLDSYGHKSKTAADNGGVEWKAVANAFRAGYQMMAIYKTGDYEYPLENSDFMIQVKLGQLDYEHEVQPKLQKLVDDVHELSISTKLRDTVNTDYWNWWLIETMKARLR
jgi:predicted nucleotidyltransferase